MTRGNNKRDLFLCEADFQFYLHIIARFSLKYGLDVYHFVFMTNHVHLLLEPTKSETLSRFMRQVNQEYARHFHLRYGTIGHVFQERFKAIPIEDEAYYLACARYIELNPVRAGIVDHPGAYKWSSYKISAQKESSAWVKQHPILADMSGGAREKTAYERYVEDEIKRAQAGASDRFSERPFYGSSPEFIARFQP